MNYATLRTHDVANGVGIRVSLFVSGCRHKCKGCFNKEAWDFDYGDIYSEETERKIIEALAPSYIKGFSLLGGEPFDPNNRKELVALLGKIKESYPEKTVWCYTGYELDSELLRSDDPNVMTMLRNIDVLVDGRFVEEKKDLSLRFRGSSNQRIIDVKATLAGGEIVLAKEFY